MKAQSLKLALRKFCSACALLGSQSQKPAGIMIRRFFFGLCSFSKRYCEPQSFSILREGLVSSSEKKSVASIRVLDSGQGWAFLPAFTENKPSYRMTCCQFPRTISASCLSSISTSSIGQLKKSSFISSMPDQKKICFRKATIQRTVLQGRLELWLPSTSRSSFLPLQTQQRLLVWEEGTKESSSAERKKAGILHLAAKAIGLRSQMLKFAFSLIVPLIIFMPMLSTKPGTLVCFLQSCSASNLRLLNGLSSTSALMSSGFSSISEVAAPMLLPHSAILLQPFTFRSFTTTRRSLLSQQPKLMYSPSDRPHPAASKAQTWMPSYSSGFRMEAASCRDELLPCRYTTTGALGQSSSLQRESYILRVYRTLSWQSVRWHRPLPVSKWSGPNSPKEYSRRGGLMMSFQSCQQPEVRLFQIFILSTQGLRRGSVLAGLGVLAEEQGQSAGSQVVAHVLVGAEDVAQQDDLQHCRRLAEVHRQHHRPAALCENVFVSAVEVEEEDPDALVEEVEEEDDGETVAVDAVVPEEEHREVERTGGVHAHQVGQCAADHQQEQHDLEAPVHVSIQMRKQYEYPSYKLSYQLKPKESVPQYNNLVKKAEAFVPPFSYDAQFPYFSTASSNKKLYSSKSTGKVKDPYKDLYDQDSRKRLSSIETPHLHHHEVDEDSVALKKRLQAKIQELKRRNKTEDPKELRREATPPLHLEYFQTRPVKSANSEDSLQSLLERVERVIQSQQQEEHGWEQQRARLKGEVERLSKLLRMYEWSKH